MLYIKFQACSLVGIPGIYTYIFSTSQPVFWQYSSSHPSHVSGLTRLHHSSCWCWHQDECGSLWRHTADPMSTWQKQSYIFLTIRQPSWSMPPHVAFVYGAQVWNHFGCTHRYRYLWGEGPGRKGIMKIKPCYSTPMVPNSGVGGWAVKLFFLT